MSAHTGPHRPEGHVIIGILWGLVFTVFILAAILVPALLIAAGLWWVLVLIGVALWVVVVRGRMWRP